MTSFLVLTTFLLITFSSSFWAHSRAATTNAEINESVLGRPAAFSSVGIIRGMNATQGEAPYQVGLFINGSFQCGGSLIGDRTVLSAAHCVSGDLNARHFSIRYGTLDIEQGGEEVAVLKVIPHPLYNQETIDYDVSVFHLAAPFKKGPNAAIVELAREDPHDGTAANVTGWGMVSTFSFVCSGYLRQ